MKRYTFLVLVVIALAVSPGHVLADDLTVLPTGENGDGTPPPALMMRNYLMTQWESAHQKWRADYEARTTPEAIGEYQSRMRKQFENALGDWPQRTPLNPSITGVVQREGYRVEKVIFESMPGVYVSAAMFVPESDAYEAPFPAVLFVCGHTHDGKAGHLYQPAAALLALNGIAALMVDPIDQGERLQLVDESGNAPIRGTTAHQMLGVQSILLGRNTAWFEIWDNMRGIDYLQSRGDIDPTRIGCMGNSGGGTQTAQLMALDDRIVAAAPSCYITSFDRLLHTVQAQDAEQCIFGQLAFGMDHADYLMMRAPMPTLICAATKDFFDIQGTWDSFRDAKRVYSRLGFAERIDIIEHDATHGYAKPLREASVRWMVRWLRGEDRPITEPDIIPLSADEITASPRGQVMLMDGARSVYEVNQAYEQELKQQRDAYWSSIDTAHEMDHARQRIREITGIRKLEDLPKPKVTQVDVIEHEKFVIEKLIIEPESGIRLPALLYRPKQLPVGISRHVLLALKDDGKAFDGPYGRLAEKLASEDGLTIMTVGLRGLGETRQTNAVLYNGAFGGDGKDVALAYLLGRNYVAMRAHDILSCAMYVRDRFTPDGPQLSTDGHMTGISALHAAALEPQLFRRTFIENSLRSWADVIDTPLTQNQYVTVVHGALRCYDLPNLELLANEKREAWPTELPGWIGNPRPRLNLRTPIGADLKPIE